jgi:predicted permease
VFRALLALYPGEFRDEYGRELALVFTDRFRDEPGVAGKLRVALEALAGVLREAPKEHVTMLLQDLRYAGRVLRRTPGFTAIAIATLALGIGANVAIFQLIDAVRFRTLSVPQPHELARVRIAGGNGGFGLNGGPYADLTQPVWQELRRHQQAFSALFAFAPWDLRVGERSDLRRVKGLAVSHEFFRVLGVGAWRGRLIEAADEAPCPTSRAVLSHGYWQREFGGREPGGLRLKINGQSHEVIGVTPAGFLGIAVGETFDVIVPLCRPGNLRRDVFDVAVIGRLRPEWTLERASAHVNALSAGIFDATAPTGYTTGSIERFKRFRLEAVSAATGVSVLREEYDTSLQLLMAITGLVLLLACANIANLLLARAVTREREYSVRLAIGASRVRLLRQGLAESGVLAACGAVVGVGLAQILSRLLLRALSTDGGGPTLSLAADWRTIAFAAVTAAATCLIFGIAPALRATRIQPAEVMKAGGRGLTAGSRLSFQRFMVVTQIAVSLVLLVAALLFVRSFRNLITFDAGMRQEGITVAFFAFHQLNLPKAAINDAQRRILADVQSIPGVVSAATTTNVPLVGGSWTHGVHVGAVNDSAKFAWVSPGYFETMKIPMVEGRDVTLDDRSTTTRVAVVNQAFVRHFIRQGTAIGQRLRTDPEPNYPSAEYEVVGVVADTRYDELRSPVHPMVFVPDSQHPSPGPWSAMMVHSSLDHATMAASIKRRISTDFPDTIMEFSDFHARIRAGLVRERLLAMLAGFFGVLAALLAMIGLYGMISFAVGQRRHEIGIRLALGARRRQVIAMVMRDASWLLAVGIVVGAIFSLVSGRSAATLLFGLTPQDVPTLSLACLLLIAVTGIASYLPARTASRLDPLTALRHE